MRGERLSRRIVNAGKALLGKPICNRAYHQKQSNDILAQVSWFDSGESDWQNARDLLSNKIDLPDSAIGHIRWLLCQFHHPYGGVFTVLRIAEALQKQGYRNTISIYDNPDFDWDKFLPLILDKLPGLKDAAFDAFSQPDQLEASEYAVATFWPSTQHLLKMKNVQHKLYLIQDFEPAFYPAGTSYALAEMSYRMPFHRLCNTPGLKKYVDSNYPQNDIRSISFTPAVDDRYKRKARELKKPLKILFYTRPGTPRNAFELALAFARELKEQYGDSVILVGAGAVDDEWKEMTKGILKWAGVLPYDKLPDFYACFNIVVAFMLTKHPSYLPFEAMAAGCAVIANENEANKWFLRDGENCVLAQPTVPALMEAFERASSAENYEKLTLNAGKTIDNLSWDKELERVVELFKSLHERFAN